MSKVRRARWPAIYRAAEIIARDNGGINRSRSEAIFRRELSRLLARHDNELSRPIDTWLATLSDSDMETVCAGEVGEQEAVLVSSPSFTNVLLDQIFEEVA